MKSSCVCLETPGKPTKLKIDKGIDLNSRLMARRSTNDRLANYILIFVNNVI